MVGFLYKDIKSSRNFILLIILMQCIISTAVLFSYLFNQEETIQYKLIISILCYYLMFLLISAGNQGAFNGDERQVWQYFAISTPGAMKAQIQSKYILLLFLNLIVFSCCMITDAITTIILKNTNYTLALPLMILFCWNLIKDSLSLPFCYAYGVSYGNKVKVLVLYVIVICIGIFVLFGDISYFMSEGLIDGVKKLFSEGNGVWVIAIIPYIAGLGYYISYRISLLGYRKGIENYE